MNKHPLSSKLDSDDKISEEFDNNEKKGVYRIHTRISLVTKTRWNRFLLSRHNTIRGEYGPELERAMNQYMDNCSPDDAVIPHKKINKNTLNTLISISRGFKNLPTYPLTQPVIVKSVIKNHSQYDDGRTIKKYQEIVVKYSKEVAVPSDMFPQLDVEGFCNYVDRLFNESHMK